MKRPEHASERRFVDATWRRTIGRMRVKPNSGKALGREPGIDLFIEKVGDRSVVEIDRHDRTSLAHEPHVFNQ